MKIKVVELEEKELLYIKEVYDDFTQHTKVIFYLSSAAAEDLESFIPVSNNGEYQSQIICTETKEKSGFCYYSELKPGERDNVSVEVTLYLHPLYRGKGYGKNILSIIEELIRKFGYKTVIAVVDAENNNDMRLFEDAKYSRQTRLKKTTGKYDRQPNTMFYQKVFN